MTRFVIKYDKNFRRLHLFASAMSVLPSVLWSLFALKLGRENMVGASSPCVGIITFQLTNILIYLIWDRILAAYYVGLIDGLNEFNKQRDRLKDCRIQDIPGMERPIFIRPDEPGEKE